MPALVPCPSCARHVATIETACPFCGSTLPDDLAARVIPSATRRLSRAAMFTFATTVAAAGAAGACSSSSSTGGGSDGGNDDGQVQAAYGCPAPQCEPVDSGGPIDDGSVGALYGVAAGDH